MNSESKISLLKELRENLPRRALLLSAGVFVLTLGLYISWSVNQRSVLQNRLRESMANTLAEPITQYDLIAIKRTFDAFQQAAPQAQLCLRIGNDWVKGGSLCNEALMVRYVAPLTTHEYWIGVQVPLFEPGTVLGLGFVFFAIVLLTMALHRLKSIAGIIANDLDHLQDTGATYPLHFEELEEARTQMQKTMQDKADAEMGRLVAQIAHDIRSPLAAFGIVLKDASDIPEEKRGLLEMISTRIRDIAEDLLNRRRSFLKNEEAELIPLITYLVNEKRIQWNGSKKDLLLLWNPDPALASTRLRMNPKEFQRMVSNLLNNAEESIDQKGRIEISLTRDSKSTAIAIQDTGKGIPHKTVEMLLKSGGTFGKTSGSGLGISHAKQFMKTLGGSFNIESSPGRGTRVCLEFPSCS